MNVIYSLVSLWNIKYQSWLKVLMKLYHKGYSCDILATLVEAVFKRVWPTGFGSTSVAGISRCE